MGAESKRSLFTGPDATVSLIIPCWKDVEAACALARSWAAHSLIQEVIIAGVQGHGLSAAGDSVTFTHSCRPGRGRQMNDGAAKARGDVLLFHHVDSTLTTRHVESLVAAMRDPAVVGGAFYRKFDERHPFMQWAEPIERWHSRTFGALYGDQSIFVRRAHFIRLGGFAPVPLMEDVEFSLRLRRSGKIALLDPPMTSSPAKQIAHGAWRTTGRNMLFLLLFRAGVSADFLHRWYYGVGSHARPPDNQDGISFPQPLETDQLP